MIKHVYLSDFHNCAYALDEEGFLIYTALEEDLTYQTDISDWVEVDFTSLEQGSDELVHAEWVRNHLRVLKNGLFANPMCYN